MGTYALEIFDELPKPDFFVPVGLGSGICGTTLVAAHVAKRSRGASGNGPCRYYISWREGRNVETAPRTFAEGAATRMPADMTLEIMLPRPIWSWSRRKSCVAIRCSAITHNLAEGGRGIDSRRVRCAALQEKTVVGIFSGGTDLQQLAHPAKTELEPETQ